MDTRIWQLKKGMRRDKTAPNEAEKGKNKARILRARYRNLKRILRKAISTKKRSAGRSLMRNCGENIRTFGMTLIRWPQKS